MKGFFSNIKKLSASPVVKKAKVATCADCPLHDQSCAKSEVQLIGDGKKNILILTGTMNIKNKSFERLEAELDLVGIDLYNDCYMTSVIQSTSPRHSVSVKKNGKLVTREVTDSQKYIECCRHKVHGFINEMQPTVILAMGDRVMDSLVKHRSTFRGMWPSIDNWVGHCIPDQAYGAWVIPIWPLNRLDEYESNPNGKVYTRRFREFMKWIPECLKKGNPPIRHDEDKIEVIIDDDHAIERMEECISYCHKNDHVLSFDYETTGVKPFLPEHKIVCVSLAWKDDLSVSFMLNEKTWPKFNEILIDRKIKKCGHNIQFEELWTRICSPKRERVANWKQDTMLDAHILDNRTGLTGLKLQTYLHFGVAGYDDETNDFLDATYPNDLNRIFELPPKTVLKYCALDSLYTLWLAKKQDAEFERLAKINPMILQARKLFKDGAIALVQMVETGFKVDKKVLQDNAFEIKKRIAELYSLIMEDENVKKWKRRMGTAFNLNSNEQLADTLFKHMGFESTKQTASGKAATDAKTLSEISGVPFLEHKAEIKKLEKLIGTYIDGINREAPDGYLHAFYPLNGPRTFRSSSNSPNIQNVPKRWPLAKKVVRSALFPPFSACFFEADYRSLEVNIGACVTGDTMIETIDGKQSILEVIKRVNNHEDVYVYGYDRDKCRIAVSRVTDGGITRKNAEVWRVTLDNGEVIDATPDHMFLLRSGEYCSLKELKPNISLMPFYTNTHLAKHGISIEEYKKTYNHKVVSIEYLGVQDVYNLNVEGIHNYAVGAGVVIKNCYHQDKNMLKYLEGHGDMHTDAALDAFLLHDHPELMTKPLRQGGKNGFVFPEFYGDYYGNCAVELWKTYVLKEKLSDGTPVKSWLAKHGIKTFEQFSDHMKEVEDILWHERFADFHQWREDLFAEYCRTGQYWNKTGFPYYGIMNKKDCSNYAVQGSAFHVNLYSMIELDKEIYRNGYKSRMCSEIHDAIIGAITPDELNVMLPLINTIMVDRAKAKFPWIISPLGIDIELAPLNRPWTELKEVALRKNECVCGCQWGFPSKPDETGRIRWDCPICEHFEYEVV